jgi:hypothetical protein
VHAELDEEEVPEGFTIGLGNDASRTNPEEQASGGKKRAADEVLIASCSVSLPCLPIASTGPYARVPVFQQSRGGDDRLLAPMSTLMCSCGLCVQDGEDGGEPSAKRARS